MYFVIFEENGEKTVSDEVFTTRKDAVLYAAKIYREIEDDLWKEKSQGGHKATYFIAQKELEFDVSL